MNNKYWMFMTRQVLKREREKERENKREKKKSTQNQMGSFDP